MFHVYINYPNPKISVHYDGSCPFIRMTGKQGQRQVTINANNIASELLKFQAKEYLFGSAPINNDMWITLDLDDSKREMDAVRYVQQLIGVHYRPLREAEIQVHCDTHIKDRLSLIGLPLCLESVLKPDAAADTLNSRGDHISEIERKLRQLEEKIRGG